jgi:MerR family transcriptional regulator/heat shock protein HspR
VAAVTPGHGGVYNIGVVSRLTGLHEQTIRQYERLGLVEPQRSPGGTRLFSEHDVARLRSIASLTRDMGVNLAGVEIILRMRERHYQLIALIRELINNLDESARARIESYLRGDEPGLIPTGEQKIAVHKPTERRRIDIKDGDK